MDNYILATSWGNAAIRDRIWYCMDESDKDTLKAEKDLYFGDKCYILKTGQAYIYGNDKVWYIM